MPSATGITDPACLPIRTTGSVVVVCMRSHQSGCQGRQWEQSFDLRTFILNIPGFQSTGYIKYLRNASIKMTLSVNLRDKMDGKHAHTF